MRLRDKSEGINLSTVRSTAWLTYSRSRRGRKRQVCEVFLCATLFNSRVTVGSNVLSQKVKKVPAGLGYHNAGNEGCMEGRPQRALLPIRQDLCANTRRAGLEPVCA